jgi:hypothetical protein
MLASSRNPAAYLANLKPVLDAATSIRTSWLRALNAMAEDPDIGERTSEATALAIRTREQFNEARRALNGMTAPDVYRDMERSLDGWLEALSASCDALANAVGQVTPDQVNNARRKLKEAAEQADKFNAERASIITVGGPPPGDAVEDPTEKIGNNKRLIVLTLLGLVLMIVALYFAFGALGSSSTVTQRGPAGGIVEKKVYQRSEILDKLKAEIANRQVAWLNPDVKLLEPDRVIISGAIQGPTGQIPAEAELQLGVTDNGQPNATGVTLPPGVLDALNKRTDEANKTLPTQLGPNQFVRKLYVDKDTVVAEVESVGAQPTAGAKPTAKPGG